MSTVREPETRKTKTDKAAVQRRQIIGKREFGQYHSNLGRLTARSLMVRKDVISDQIKDVFFP